MIKKYRNALLAAAVASVAVGCGGGSNTEAGSGEDPFNNPNLPINLTTGPDEYTHQALAQLLTSAFYELINTTSTVFDSVEASTSPTGTMGKVLGPIITGGSSGGSAAGAIEANTSEPIPCSLGGTFNSKISLGLSISDPNALSLDVLAEEPVDIGIQFAFAQCNEPNHVGYTSDGDPSTTDAPILETDEEGNVVNSLIDGRFTLSLRSSPGDAGNDSDYSLNTTIEMRDYFIQRYSEGSPAPRPSVLNGTIDMSLVTTDSETYLMTLGTNLANNNSKGADGGGFIKTSLLAEGNIELDIDTFDIGNYSLNIDGSLRNYKVSETEDFQIYTIENLANNPGDPVGTRLLDLLNQPTSGKLATTIRSTGETSTLTVTDTGFSVETNVDGTTEIYTCTWQEINDQEC